MRGVPANSCGSLGQEWVHGKNMKTRLLPFIIPLLVMAACWPGHAQTGGQRTSDVMKLKLDHVQRLLEAIATENYDALTLDAEMLAKLSQAAGWRVRETPQYELFSAEFRRHVNALAKAAKDRNVDAASLAYVQMTLSCVQCHKYVRNPKTAGLR
jgi:hypothetical protein